MNTTSTSAFFTLFILIYPARAAGIPAKSVSRLMDNIALRGRDYEQHISPEYLQKLEVGYWAFFKQQIHIPVVVIESDNIDFVHNQDDYDVLLKSLTRNTSRVCTGSLLNK
jgi:deoxyadenosine/deoxycytidine kinase